MRQTVHNEESLNQVKTLFKRVSDFIRVLDDDLDNLPRTLTNVQNVKLYKTLSRYVDDIGVDYPLQAKILKLKYFELKTTDQISKSIAYERTLIFEKQKEALNIIAQRFFSSHPQGR